MPSRPRPALEAGNILIYIFLGDLLGRKIIVLSDGTVRTNVWLNQFCGLVDVNPGPAANTTYEIVTSYSDEPTDQWRHSASFGWESMEDVPVPLRAMLDCMIARLFRRRIDLPRHIMIARTQAVGEQEAAFKGRTTEVTTGPQGELYLYVNEPVIAVPFLYVFMIGSKGA